MVTQNENNKPAIVLVHGGFVDGSGWQGVYKILRKDGYTVTLISREIRGDIKRVE